MTAFGGRTPGELIEGLTADLMFSVLIVDDDRVACHGLKQILKEEFPGVTFGEATNTTEALFKIFRQPWRMIVLNVDIHAGSGFQILEKIIEKRLQAKVLVLSAYSESQYAARAFRLGACGYVAKDAGRAKLLAAFASVLAVETHVSSPPFHKLTQCTAEEAALGPEILSPRERLVLLALAEGKRITNIASESPSQQQHGYNIPPPDSG